MLYLFHLEFKDAALKEKVSGGAVLSFYGSGQPFHRVFGKSPARWESRKLSAISSLTSTFSHQMEQFFIDLGTISIISFKAEFLTCETSRFCNVATNIVA